MCRWTWTLGAGFDSTRLILGLWTGTATVAFYALSSSQTIQLAPQGVGASAVGYRVQVTGSSDWSGSLVLKSNTAPPGNVPSYVNLGYQNPSSRAEVAAGTAITQSGAFIVSVPPGDLSVTYTHTAGVVNVTVSPATAGVTNSELAEAFAAAGFETAGQDTPVTMLSASVAMLLGQSLNVTAFGAVGDGVTDDTEAIRRAVTACPDGGTVMSPGGFAYRLSSAIEVSGKTIHFDFTGCTVTQAGADRILVYDAGLTFTRAVTAVDANAHTLEMDTSDIDVGDVLKLVSDDRLEGTRPADGADESRRGQYLTVDSVDGTHVTFNENLRYAFTTNVRCAKLSGKTVTWRGGAPAYAAGTTGVHTCFDIYNAVRPSFDDVSFGYLPFIGISFKGCYEYRVVAPAFAKSLIDSPNFGHGISDWSCYGGYVENARSGHLRCVFTTNQNPIPADSDDIWAYGPSYGGHVVFGNGAGDVSTGFDTHHGCEDFTFTGGMVLGGQLRGFGVRGRRITLNHPTTFGTVNGLLVHSESGMAEVDYTEDVTINHGEFWGCTGAPVEFQRVRGAVLNQPRFHASARFNALSLIASDVRIVGGEMRADGNATADQSLILLDDASTLEWVGTPLFSIDNHTGTGARMVSFTGEGRGVFRAERIQWRSNTDIALTLFNNPSDTDAFFDVGELWFDVGPTAITRTTDDADFEAESAIRYYGSVTIPSVERDNTITDTQVLTFAFARDAHIIQVLNAAGPVSVGGFPAGKFPGQRVTLYSRTAEDITIPDGAGSNGITINNHGSASVVLTAARDNATWIWAGDTYEWRQIGEMVT